MQKKFILIKKDGKKYYIIDNYCLCVFKDTDLFFTKDTIEEVSRLYNIPVEEIKKEFSKIQLSKPEEFFSFYSDINYKLDDDLNNLLKLFDKIYYFDDYIVDNFNYNNIDIVSLCLWLSNNNKISYNAKNKILKKLGEEFLINGTHQNNFLKNFILDEKFTKYIIDNYSSLIQFKK